MNQSCIDDMLIERYQTLRRTTKSRQRRWARTRRNILDRKKQNWSSESTEPVACCGCQREGSGAEWLKEKTDQKKQKSWKVLKWQVAQLVILIVRTWQGAIYTWTAATQLTNSATIASHFPNHLKLHYSSVTTVMVVDTTPRIHYSNATQTQSKHPKSTCKCEFKCIVMEHGRLITRLRVLSLEWTLKGLLTAGSGVQNHFYFFFLYFSPWRNSTKQRINCMQSSHIPSWKAKSKKRNERNCFYRIPLSYTSK